MKLLITSFGPFKKFAKNPSNEVMMQLQKSLESDFLASNSLKWHILDVSWQKIDEFMNEIENDNYDFIVHLGVATNSPTMRLELNAKNNCSGIDVFDSIPPNSKISERDYSLSTNINAQLLEKFTKKNEDKVRLSEDAGTYLCNYIYYKSLELFRHNSKVIFIHIADYLNKEDAAPLTKQTELIKELLMEITSSRD